MFFNQLRVTALVLSAVSVVVFSGCDRLLRSSQSESEKKNAGIVELSPQGLECLKEAPKIIQSYFNDQASEEQIHQVSACLGESLSTFVKFTQGKEANTYTDQELRHFFNRYLLKENQISPEFMIELMKIKTVIVGGAKATMTRAELDRIQSFIKILSAQLIQTRGLWKVYLFKAPTGTVNGKDLAIALEKGRGFIRQVIGASRLAGSLYELSDLKSFISELSGFLGQSPELAEVTKWIPLVESLKVLFMGKHSPLNTEREWLDSLDWAARAYFLAIEYRYQIHRKDFSMVPSWNQLLDFVDRTLDVVEEAPVFQRDGKLQTVLIDRALDEFWKLDLFKTLVLPETVKKSYRMVILRVLERNPSRQAVAIEVHGLDRRHLSVLRIEYNIWKMTQTWINEQFQDGTIGAPVAYTKLLSAAVKFNHQSEIKKMKEAKEQSDLFEVAWKDWQRLLKQDPALRWTLYSTLEIGKPLKSDEVSFVGLNYMNALRSLTRLVQRGYGEGQSRQVWNLHLKEKGLVSFEEDFRELGQAIGFLDPRSHNPGGRTFKEASFFTFHGNGNEYLSGLELFEELNLMISGGQTLTSWLIADGEHYKCATGEIDKVLSKPVFYENCFKDMLRKQNEFRLQSMPMLSREIKDFSSATWEEFYAQLMVVAGLEKRRAGIVEFAEIRTAVMVLQYVEVLMQVYDTNSNGRLSLDEMKIAAPRFRRFISGLADKEIAKSLPRLQKFLPGLRNFDDIVDHIFLCMMYEGRRPGVNDLITFAGKRALGLGEIGRTDLVRVLSVLKKDAVK